MSTATSSYAVNWNDVTLNGYFIFEYEKNVAGEREGDTNGSFDLDLLDLVINFNLSNQLRIATDLTWEHGSATEEGFGNVAVEYAFAEYTFLPAFKLRAGKMFTSFGIYNEIHTAKPAALSVKEPLSTNKNNKMGSEFRFYPRWNVGITALGDFIWADRDFDYVVQLSNGDDKETNPFEEDTNTSKAIGGRLRGNISDNLQFGFSFHRDHMNSDDENGMPQARIRITSYGFHAHWLATNHIQAEFEYVRGSVKRDTVKNIERDAYSLMFSSEISNGITPYLRYEVLEPDKDTGNDEGLLTVLGINCQVAKNAYIKFELNEVDTEKENKAFKGKGNIRRT